jgi:hypothetical protein
MQSRRVYQIRLQLMTYSIESLADQLPESWGARLEIMLRQLGEMIWIQIASAIVLLRHLVAIPYLATAQRTPTSLPDGLTNPPSLLLSLKRYWPVQPWEVATREFVVTAAGS